MFTCLQWILNKTYVIPKIVNERGESAHVGGPIDNPYVPNISVRMESVQRCLLVFKKP